MSNPQFITDAHGNRSAVILDIKTYQKMRQDLDALAAIRTADDEAQANPGELIPLEEALKEIESMRKDL